MSTHTSEQPTPPSEPSPIEVIHYEGPLGYYYRHQGIEEGAHAVYQAVKSKNEKGLADIGEVQRSIQEVDPENEQRNDYKTIYCDSDLFHITNEDLTNLVIHTDKDFPPFKGNVAQAVYYCRQFLGGMLVPVKKVYRDTVPSFKFGLAIPAPGKNIYSYFYSPKMDTVFMNRELLEENSQYPPTAIITTTLDGYEYNDQNHEQRALLWQIRDAHKFGLNDIAELLRSQYRRHA